MNKYLKAIDDIENEYDAYFISNKYDEKLRSNTHKEQFELLLLDKFKDDEIGQKALYWIIHMYDCYYKGEYNFKDESPFDYLRKMCKDDR